MTRNLRYNNGSRLIKAPYNVLVAQSEDCITNTAWLVGRSQKSEEVKYKFIKIKIE